MDPLCAVGKLAKPSPFVPAAANVLFVVAPLFARIARLQLAHTTACCLRGGVGVAGIGGGALGSLRRGREDVGFEAEDVAASPAP